MEKRSRGWVATHVRTRSGQALTPPQHEAITESVASTEREPMLDDPLTSRSPFRHTALDLSKSTIRLLKLYKYGEQLRCSIRHVNLDEKPEYHALSYTWGPDHPTYEILCNGQVYLVRENLYRFLQLMRMEGFEGHLWIDQISIDQDNTDERNHQVTMMTRIYQNAARVIIWLGEADVSTGLVVAALEETDTKGFSSSSKQDLDALIQLLRQPYWSRLWIAQEIMVATSHWIRWGRFSIDIKLIAPLAFRIANSHDARFILSDAQAAMVRKLGVYMAHIHHREPSHVLPYRTNQNILWNLHRNHCADPRDKLYGLLALLDFGSNPLEVDYAKPVEQVYLDIVRLWYASHAIYTLTTEKILPLADLAQSMLPTDFTTEVTEAFKAWLKTSLERVKERNDPIVTPRDQVQPWLTERVVAFLSLHL